MKKTNQIHSEFQEFMKDSSQGTPALSSELRREVSEDLNPKVLRVFTKLLGIHFASSLVTLSICPQFGFRFFGTGPGVMHYFMGLGSMGCLVACGSFFMSVSLLLAGMMLKREELRRIRENRILVNAALVLLSLGFFTMFDAEWVLSISLAWFLGAMLGSVVTLEMVWRLRKGWH